MSKKYTVRHETNYKYTADVMHSHHLLHLVPRPTPYQECYEHEIQIEPAGHRRVNGLDAFGNPLIRLELAQPHRELRVVSQMQIEVHARPAVSPETTEPWEKVRDSFAYRGAWPSRDQLDAARFRHESPGRWFFSMMSVGTPRRFSLAASPMPPCPPPMMTQ